MPRTCVAPCLPGPCAKLDDLKHLAGKTKLEQQNNSKIREIIEVLAGDAPNKPHARAPVHHYSTPRRDHGLTNKDNAARWYIVVSLFSLSVVFRQLTLLLSLSMLKARSVVA